MDDDRVVTVTTTATTTTGVVVAAAGGRVTPVTATHLRDRLAKLLADGHPVVLDVSDLRLEWAPSPEVFVTAVAAAGGWPVARLVLFGADEHTTHRLLACRVPASVPLARTEDEASALVGARPAQLSFGTDLPVGQGAIGQARTAVRSALERWGVAELGADADAVTTELVRNAVEHAGTPVRLRLTLDRAGLRISVRDGRPGRAPAVRPRGGGLRTVARLSRTWGTLELGDAGKAVWAQLPLSRTAVAPTPADDRAPDVRRDRSGSARRAAAGLRVSPPRRRRFVTADPELAQAFLRGVYGEHTLRLSGTGPAPEFQLEYEGVATDRFAVERLTHLGAVQTELAAGDALVVVHPLAGEVRVATRQAATRVAAGEVLLCRDSRLVVESARVDLEVVRIGVAAFRRVAAETAGFDAATAPAYLTPAASSARAALWRATVAHLRRDVLVNEEVLTGAEFRVALLRQLVATLVATFPVLRDDTERAHAIAASAVVRRAVAFVEEHATEDIGLSEIAAAAGVGARGLQMAFRRHVDATPLEYLRGVRLAGAHRDLRAAGADEVTVGAVAARWGFTHHGTFSTLYLRAYGCSPRMTLRA